MQPEGLPEATPRPVLEVAYYADDARSFLAIVRSIGVLAVLIGGSTLIYVVAGLLSIFTLISPTQWMGIAYYIASVVLAIVWLVAGISCLRSRPRGRRFVISAAWGMLILQAYAVVTTSWTMLTYNRNGLSLSTIASVMATQLRFACSSVAFPVIVLILIRHASIRNVFESQ